MDYDLFVIGGGINGCGIARDAVGRGLKVGLAEMGDLAGATSSASTKLFHGGLRYLEYWEVRLVREALRERDVLLRNMPHIAWPMRFVLPLHRDMRFEGDTPTSKLLSAVMPWMRGRRPDWLIRTGLAMYDNLARSKYLPGTATVPLRGTPEGAPLEDRFEKAFEYSDAWVEDSRLVVLNARDAADRGADVMVRTKVVSAEAKDGGWAVTLEGGRVVTARMLVNAAGPWVGDVIRGVVRANTQDSVRLVRGSHIVTKSLFDHGKCYFFQGEDGRIIFAIPYETDFTLIGTTDAEHEDADQKPVISEAERDYLIAFVNRYLKRDVSVDDIVHTYSGVRPLYDDGASSATAATRDYVLKVDRSTGAPVLNVFGGKITTYRKLAEAAVGKIVNVLPASGGPWTKDAPLPGGDFPVDGVAALVARTRARYGFLSDAEALRLVRAYGTEVADVLGEAASWADLGEAFGAGLTAREVEWQVEREWARTAEDVLWRRTKLGLRIDDDGRARLERFLAEATAEAA
ncbi:glycerol-3-phosphate dehydrogenase [Jannaschia sp. Os4]|uniref:glycerol-3-phosphate dehydrogenase n=1 Tax=Jannaschia sp. Os4 TaxID=2807617 RepID=UPI001939E2F7|nr:glycerol-3-phosphate dehydrogenase [Jannaschia sp. Os4]MBM2576261.1 glycerol-3-phosphate dehydrogenase [Jannaschia sp. Os4]